MLLEIVPLGELPENVITEVTYAIMDTFNSEIQIDKSLDIPKEAFDTFRKQYLASSILNYLSKRFNENVLAITTEDMYAEKLNFVFGQAKLNGNVAVVSIHRLNPKFYNKPENNELFLERILKESIHEVGHMAFGLKHCSNSNCVMSFSNTIFDVDKKSKNLCSNCKSLARIY